MDQHVALGQNGWIERKANAIWQSRSINDVLNTLGIEQSSTDKLDFKLKHEVRWQTLHASKSVTGYDHSKAEPSIAKSSRSTAVSLCRIASGHQKEKLDGMVGRPRG